MTSNCVDFFLNDETWFDFSATVRFHFALYIVQIYIEFDKVNSKSKCWNI